MAKSQWGIESYKAPGIVLDKLIGYPYWLVWLKHIHLHPVGCSSKSACKQQRLGFKQTKREDPRKSDDKLGDLWKEKFHGQNMDGSIFLQLLGVRFCFWLHQLKYVATTARDASPRSRQRHLHLCLASGGSARVTRCESWVLHNEWTSLPCTSCRSYYGYYDVNRPCFWSISFSRKTINQHSSHGTFLPAPIAVSSPIVTPFSPRVRAIFQRVVTIPGTKMGWWSSSKLTCSWDERFGTD